MTSFVGLGGGALRGIGGTVRHPITYRVGNWMIMSAAAGDAGTFLDANAEALASRKRSYCEVTRELVSTMVPDECLSASLDKRR